MRRALIVLFLSVAGAALAGGNKDLENKKPKPIEVKANADKLEVWKDDLGQYYVVPTLNAFTFDEAGAWVFYGDGKTMYQQRIIGSGTAAKGYDWTIWSPRVKTVQAAGLETKNDRLTVSCGVKDTRALTQLKADEAKVFFAKTTFYPPLWQRQTRFLARDDDGVYYFVDELRDEYGGQGYRVFVGQKGTMKEMGMTNVVEDSGGFIFATKGGSLKIISDKKLDTAYWVKGGKKLELTVLVPNDNRHLIYRDLGIYGSIGTVCDDL
ncbi:MAG TPA: hypothetical protein VFQ65_14240 [Kofleriaceae bacterium]|nr:hypothetical protein [Kofleriaceae bacterium]